MALGLGALLAFASPAVAAPVEVLAVTASSTDGMLMDAVDGDAETAWQNRREGERGAWLAVRLVKEARIRGVRLLLDPLGPDSSFDVEVSRDGEAFIPVLTGLRAGGERVFPRPVPALYLRVRFGHAGNQVAPRFRLRELEVIGS